MIRSSGLWYHRRHRFSFTMRDCLGAGTTDDRCPVLSSAAARAALGSSSHMRILRDLINVLGEGIQTTVLLIETSRQFLSDGRHTLIDLTQMTGHRFLRLINMARRGFGVGVNLGSRALFACSSCPTRSPSAVSESLNAVKA